MVTFNRLSVKNKLMAVMLLTSALVLLAVGVALVGARLGALAKQESAHRADQDEKDRRGHKSTAGEEAERHGDHECRACKRAVFHEAKEQIVCVVVLGVVHLRAHFDRTGRRVISHRQFPLQRACWPDIAKRCGEGNGGIAAETPSRRS